jgi:hypothetical protein
LSSYALSLVTIHPFPCFKGTSMESLQGDVAKFTSYFTKVWKNLNKFTMVKVTKPLMNGDQ